MPLRWIIALVMTLTMMLASLASTSGAAEAAPAAPAKHHASPAAEQPCGQDMPDTAHHDPGDPSCCVATCVGMAVLSSSSLSPPPVGSRIDRIAISVTGGGFLVELPTPPPRLS